MVALHDPVNTPSGRRRSHKESEGRLREGEIRGKDAFRDCELKVEGAFVVVFVFVVVGSKHVHQYNPETASDDVMLMVHLPLKTKLIQIIISRSGVKTH